MNVDEIKDALSLAQAAYKASLRGARTMSWNGRTVQLGDPDMYYKEVGRLESALQSAQAPGGGSLLGISLVRFNDNG
jgi:hypothetical protein